MLSSFCDIRSGIFIDDTGGISRLFIYYYIEEQGDGEGGEEDYQGK
jgi:hypothetical protein